MAQCVSGCSFTYNKGLSCLLFLTERIIQRNLTEFIQFAFFYKQNSFSKSKRFFKSFLVLCANCSRVSPIHFAESTTQWIGIATLVATRFVYQGKAWAGKNMWSKYWLAIDLLVQQDQRELSSQILRSAICLLSITIITKSCWLLFIYLFIVYSVSPYLSRIYWISTPEFLH